MSPDCVSCIQFLTNFNGVFTLLDRKRVIIINCYYFTINLIKKKMDTRIGESNRERSRRPIRNKRYSRRAFGEDKRPPKRLFTPEIKRFLKDWLIRRRDNPYPNRDEKKLLAVQTGLTYIQVCNWFANWRRKLKNAGKEPQRKTWGDLIKTYNSQVQGNVEHFSICSDDSIWEEPENSLTFDEEAYEKFENSIHFPTNLNEYGEPLKNMDHSYTYYQENGVNVSNNNNTTSDIQNQCYFISSTTENDIEANPFSQAANKYKSHIMEKYLRDCQKPEYSLSQEDSADENKPSMISKWLESAANFKPSESSYLNWPLSNKQKKKSKTSTPKKTVSESSSTILQLHGREELDAAEALTTLANARAHKP